MLASFLLGERNNATPAPTKYLLPNERTIQEVRELLNGTLQTQKMVISIVTDDLKTEKVNVVGMGIMNTKENVQPAPYYGYSGGSMFIMGKDS